MVDLTKLLTALLELCITLILTYLVPYVKAYLREHTNAEQRQKINMWVKIAVQAAEMIYAETGMGEIKFNYVRDFLREKGFCVDDQELQLLIESAVLEMKNAMASGELLKE